LGEKAKEEVNRVEIVNQEDRKVQPVTIASLKASVLPMVSLFYGLGMLLSTPPQEAQAAFRPQVVMLERQQDHSLPSGMPAYPSQGHVTSGKSNNPSSTVTF
jgi:nucleophosmin 2